MSVKLGTTDIAGLSTHTKSNAHHLLDFFWSDHIINRVDCLRADTFSWQSGNVYTLAYNHLVNDIQNKIKDNLYAWAMPSPILYTKSKTPSVGDLVYDANGNTIDMGGGQFLSITEIGIDYIITPLVAMPFYRDDSLDIIQNESKTETINNIVITYYLADDGHKICLADQENNVISLYNATGVTWYYILDTTNSRFKLPRTKFGFTGMRDGVGKFLEAGLPNITGEFWNFQGSNKSSTGSGSSGVFTITRTDAGWTGGDSDNSKYKVDFSASRSSSIYGKSTTVQPPATQMYLYFYVGEYSQTAIEQTAGITTEQLNQKADVSLSNVSNTNMLNKFRASGQIYLKTTYVSGTSGYNIWSNGYCEQWGKVASGGAGFVTVTLLKTMKDTNYCLLNCNNRSSAAGDQRDAYIISTTQIGVGRDNSAGLWRVFGYLAEGQY